MKDELSLTDLISALERLAPADPGHEAGHGRMKVILFWLEAYHWARTEGVFVGELPPPPTARAAYNDIPVPDPLLDLIEVAGVDQERVAAARRAVTAGETTEAQARAIRQCVPWDVVQEALRNLHAPSGEQMAGPGVSSDGAEQRDPVPSRAGGTALRHGEGPTTMNADELRRRYDAGERDFRGAGLKKANLDGSCLSQADLVQASLEGASLSEVKLFEADLMQANLTGANLRRAVLHSASLYIAQLAGAVLTCADAADTDLCLACLREADLRGADLTGSYLLGADMAMADLTGANLTGVNLSAADLRGANLTGAKLGQAILAAADLTGAKLDRAAVTEDQMASANVPYEPMEGKVSTGELVRAIRRLPPDEPDRDSDVWYFTQKEHWLGWLAGYEARDASAGKTFRKRDARTVYNSIGNPQLLEYLITASGVRGDLVNAAQQATKQSTKLQAQCAAIRRIVPWEVVAEALWRPQPSRGAPDPSPDSQRLRLRAEPEDEDHGSGKTPELPENWDTLSPEEQYEWQLINAGEVARVAQVAATRRRRERKVPLIIDLGSEEDLALGDLNADWIKSPANRESEARIHAELARRYAAARAKQEPQSPSDSDTARSQSSAEEGDEF